MSYIKLTFLVGLVFIFSSCSGTGTKDLGLILPQIEEKPDNKVFITNQTGHTFLMSDTVVFLNGKSVGILGVNEILIGQGRDGKNTLKLEGKSDVFMVDSNTYTFENKNKENRFFIVNVNQKFINRVPILNEVTQQSFMSNIR